MTRLPSRSWLWSALLAVALVTSPARAEPTFGIVPVDCVQFWPASSWEELLSLAACTQDTSVGHIYFEDQIDGLLEEFDVAMMPTLRIYFAAVRNGPAPIKLRAAFQMAMTQITIMTRARLSIVPSLSASLEPKLEPTARYAWKLLVTLEYAATHNPSLTTDVVTRHMVGMGRVYADALDASWHFTRERGPVLAKTRRASWPDFTSSTPTSK